MAGNKQNTLFWPGYKFCLLLLLSVVMFEDAAQAQQLAFPGADGFGKYTTGGRGGTIYRVTNLNNSGPGSFRNGVEMKGARTIVFAVSGTIHLTSELRIRNGDLSIFGQTAPGDGIALKGGRVVIDADNIIIQYIRFRPGDISGEEVDALWGREQKDIILDHLSMSWSVDETGSFYDNENFTLQYSILSESLYRSIHDKGNHGYGGIWGGKGASFHHNLLAHHWSRNPRFNGARYTTTPENELVDFRHNVIYNWADNSAYGGEFGSHNMVANYFKPGPATRDSQKRYRILDARPPSGDFEEIGKWYIADNFVEGSPVISQDNWKGGVQRVTPAVMDTIRMDEPFEVPYEADEAAEEAYRKVLAYAGAIFPRRDAVDERIVHEVATGTATFGGVYGSESGIIDTQGEVGGWPDLHTYDVPEDSDGDGIPDLWEIEHGLNPNDPQDAKIINESGYSNLESYVHSLTQFSEIPDEVAELLSPADGEVVLSQPVFEWKHALHAETYQIQIKDAASEKALIVLDSTLSDTTFTYSDDLLEANTTYYWRVRGVNAGIAGLWSAYGEFKTQGTTSTGHNADLPRAFTLAQNYPNPFNPVTVIGFELPVSGHVQLSVFDMLGREVATLVDEHTLAGRYQVNFDAGHLSSGIYVYRLRAGGKIFTQKMTLMK